MNLQILTVTFFFIELTKSSSKELVVCISVGVVFVQFVGIMVYHTWQRISKIFAKNFMLQYKKKDRRAEEGNEQYAYQLMPEDADQVTSEKGIILKDIDKESFLEDHAVDADMTTLRTCK